MNNTLLKGLKLLEALVRQEQSMGVSELAAAVEMPKSGAHRLLQALVEAGYVVRGERGTYTSSTKLWKLGSAALHGLDLRRHADDVMNALMEQTGETVHLSVLDRYEVVYVHKIESPNPVRAYSQIGGRAAASCVATGKAIIAHKSPLWLGGAARHLRAATERSVTATDPFLAEMQKIRRNGVATNRGEWRLGVNGVAAPIFDRTGTAIAAIGLSGPEARFRPNEMSAMAEQVRRAAELLRTQLGEVTPYASLLGVTNHWVAPAE